MINHHTKLEIFILNHCHTVMLSLFTVSLLLMIYAAFVDDSLWAVCGILAVLLDVLALCFHGLYTDIKMRDIELRQRKLDEDWGEIAIESYFAVIGMKEAAEKEDDHDAK
ncbi:hypothetical protein [Nicoliella lavandulae]|uniref:Uncharacterized protein n=1 Tax=Nicoliella lavandulae TaxID=3082954 RepID=A0ABU8SM86_9LACO